MALQVQEYKMTKIVIIEVDKQTNRIDQSILDRTINKMLEGACNADGSWKIGWQLPGQTGVRVNSQGNYTVIHNLNRLDYGVSVSLIKSEGTIETKNLTDVSFDVEIKLGENLANLPFRFAINFVEKHNA